MWRGGLGRTLQGNGQLYDFVKEHMDETHVVGLSSSTSDGSRLSLHLDNGHRRRCILCELRNQASALHHLPMDHRQFIAQIQEIVKEYSYETPSAYIKDIGLAVQKDIAPLCPDAHWINRDSFKSLLCPRHYNLRCVPRYLSHGSTYSSTLHLCFRNQGTPSPASTLRITLVISTKSQLIFCIWNSQSN